MSNLISLALLMGRTARDGSKQHLDALASAIRSCGVTFHTWKEQGREQLKWTSLTGDGRKKVMKTLPSKQIEVLPHETIQETIKLWKDFHATPYLLKCQFILTLCTRRQSNGLIASCQYLQEATKRVTLRRTCTVWHTTYQSALGGMVTCESCQAKVLKNTMTMQRGHTFLVINEMPPWTSSEQKPGLIAYETMLPRKRSHKEKQCILASWRHSGSKRILEEYSITRYHHSSLVLIT